MATSSTQTAFAIVVLVCTTGCPDAEPLPDPEPMRLSEAGGWVRVDDVATDLFGAERPTDVQCDPEGYGVEDLNLTFEVRTGMCNYLTVSQPTQAAIEAGDEIAIELYHYNLTAEVPAEAHVGLGLGDAVAWETLVPIPSQAGFVRDAFQAEQDVPAGSELQFHIHNHGDNDWLLVTLTTRPAAR